MMVTSKQRQLVYARAGGCCEYCRVAESDRYSLFHIDHIIARKHGGTDDAENLCLACYKCNGYKGSHIAGIDPETDEATKLFHPRLQIWDDHFAIDEKARLIGLTPEGRVTIDIVRINNDDRQRQRYMLLRIQAYPCTFED
jgi:hypothetical protein